jgi:curved DNA-binding protein CbpA
LQISECDFKIHGNLSQFDFTKNYYEVLGAARNASRREIETLYRQLAQKRHPDRGGSEEEMKALNEAYRVLHDEVARSEYDARWQKPSPGSAAINSAPAAREVGVYGQALSALLCILLGFMLLALVRFNGLWFLWPLAILAVGVMLFGVLMAHSAITHARNSFHASHPLRRFRAAHELVFWGVVCGGGYGVYLILTAI